MLGGRRSGEDIGNWVSKYVEVDKEKAIVVDILLTILAANKKTTKKKK